MEAFKSFFIKYFERIFIIATVIILAGLHYISPDKSIMMNLYFIPVLMAAYYLDSRRFFLVSLSCVTIVGLYAILYPEAFQRNTSPSSFWLFLILWACFLLLTGTFLSRLNQKFREETRKSKILKEDLVKKGELLETAQKEIKEHAHNLDIKVAERTDFLEKSRHAIEELKNKVEETLYSTMDATVVKLLIQKRLRTEKRRISILFSDLKGFTQYSEERKPEMVISDLNKFLHEMEIILLAYHAHIDKYLGDGIMAEFGAPTHYERHSLMSVLAGMKMQERLSKEEFPWKMRVCIATGETIMGLVGNKRKTYTAVGDAVNLASRIQAICTPGIVTVDEATYQDIRQFVDTRKKTVLPLHEFEDPQFVKAIGEYTFMLDQNPDDLNLIKKLGLFLLQANYPDLAHDYLHRALELDPKNDSVKLAYAEVAMKIDQMDSFSVKGKRNRLHLFEIIRIKDSLKIRDKIPQKVYDAYIDRVRETSEYPEDLILPVESLDGSIGHARVVGFLSYALADLMGLSDQEKRDILRAAYLADIGKAIVPHHLLNRNGELSQTEFQETTKHCREGVQMLKKLGYRNESLFKMIVSHHENFNGSGYPMQLKGSDIPLGARIISVADCYDALTSWRPYRERWDYRAAYAEMGKETRNGKFDSAVFNCLGKLLGIEPILVLDDII